MEKPEKKDEWMIQQKVDGNLSAQEEEQFDELMRNSAEARGFYQNLVNLHHAIKNDSKGIPAIDFSPGIMHKLEEKQNATVCHPAKSRLFKTTSPRTLLAYAAILLTGLLAGSVATYMSTGAGHQPAGSVVSGTMAKDEGMEGYYAENGTEIKIQKTENEHFRLLTFALTTGDTIHVTINGKGDNKLEKEQVSLLFSEGIFQLADDRNGNLLCRCTGKHIFQISEGRQTKLMTISFSRNNEIFYELNPK